MWKVALLVGLVACGGSPSTGGMFLVDGSFGDGADDTCNPLTQTGCNAGEKCNWSYDQLTPTVVGHINCEPAGSTGLGAACGARALGPDPCIRGAECIAGECKQICDNQGGTPTCDAAHACVTYPGLYTSGTATVAGVCDPGCDPLTQELYAGATRTACGSPVPTLPTQGCYGHAAYSCMAVAPTVSTAVAVTLTDRVAPAGASLAACAPGFMAILIAETGSVTMVCNGLCAALETDNTVAHAGNELGDATALAKLPTEAVAATGNATCAPGKKGSESNTTCRFLWIYNVDPAGLLRITDSTDKLGVCLARDHYKYDSNNDGALTAADLDTPACNTLPPRSAATTGKYDDAADFFCQKVAHSMFTGSAPSKGDTIYVGELGVAASSASAYDPDDGATAVSRHLFTNR